MWIAIKISFSNFMKFLLRPTLCSFLAWILVHFWYKTSWTSFYVDELKNWTAIHCETMQMEWNSTFAFMGLANFQCELNLKQFILREQEIIRVIEVESGEFSESVVFPFFIKFTWTTTSTIEKKNLGQYVSHFYEWSWNHSKKQRKFQPFLT